MEVTRKVEATATPEVVDRVRFQRELDELRSREKAHTREGDAIAAARRRPPIVEESAGLELTGPDGPVSQTGLMHLICYLRDGDRFFETYWTTGRGVEAMDYSYSLWDLTGFRRQEPWEDSPTGWPQSWPVDDSYGRVDGRPIAQWSRLAAGRSDDLATNQE